MISHGSRILTHTRSAGRPQHKLQGLHYSPSTHVLECSMDRDAMAWNLWQIPTWQRWRHRKSQGRNGVEAQWKGENWNWKGDKEYVGLASLSGLVFMSTPFFSPLFQRLGCQIMPYHPYTHTLTGDHICLFHSSHTLKSLKVQLN